MPGSASYQAFGSVLGLDQLTKLFFISFYCIVVSVIRRGSIKGYAACLSIVRFSYFPHSRLSYFVEQSSFFSNLRPLSFV